MSVFNSMFLGLEVGSLNTCEMFGFAGGVTQMIVRDDGKRIIKRISDIVLYTMNSKFELNGQQIGI